MNDTVGKVIQQKRRIKGMTQEQLAQLVGVSSAAVSKWETANALPDVTLLCPLARALNCTVDELLDFTPQLTRQEVDAQMEKVRQWFEQGEWNQAVEFCENRLKEYPNDLYLALRVASLYTSYLAVTGSEEAAEQQLQKAIALMERAVEIEEETLRRNALNELAGLYAMNQQFDKALKTLDQLPECNQQAWAIRANVLMLKGELDEAQRLNCAGQHVNKTSSAVRLIHKPTGIVVSCQTERSQFQNRDTAMKMLASKLYQIKEQEHLDKISDIKGIQKEIAWGHQIRSYVFMPYTMVKDHRTGYETGNVQAVMDGDLDGFINAYLKASSRGELQDV